MAAEVYARLVLPPVSTTLRTGISGSESPDAFRSMDVICRAIKDTVDIDRIIHPLFNYRG